MEPRLVQEIGDRRQIFKRPARGRAGTLALCAVLAGCAGGEGPAPFLNPPPSAETQPPAYPDLVAPAEHPGRKPVLSEAERDALEGQLKKLATGREKSVRKKIETTPQ